MSHISRFIKQTPKMLCLLLASTFTQAAEESEVDISLGNSQIEFALTSNNIAKVLVAGPNDFRSQSNSAQVQFNSPLKDGLYTYEVTNYYFSNEVIIADGSNGRDNQTQSDTQRTKITTGQFSIINGALIDMYETE
ncbi:hypothetical protein [Pseudoalteromonas denitrificans]|jgi:hypothetical protein|uniref:Uncharacterized protein n=1 Tax=Pseudoalteromonas denitrificans DSM 6059 TaxID=1123010 RepID=A0A1I1UCP6_9GAMM|nr:hypothetical protein [Pseudoalteromonas denitrificans]SFD67378.1 hypothetical protein SAMN02745724_05157 [Pseudoalteromonas denitrificans DSM 6059]